MTGDDIDGGAKTFEAIAWAHAETLAELAGKQHWCCAACSEPLARAGMVPGFVKFRDQFWPVLVHQDCHDDLPAAPTMAAYRKVVCSSSVAVTAAENILRRALGLL